MPVRDSNWERTGEPPGPINVTPLITVVIGCP